jgi:hypothetical protein
MTGSTSAVRVAVNTRGLQNVMKRAVILSKGAIALRLAADRYQSMIDIRP